MAASPAPRLCRAPLPRLANESGRVGSGDLVREIGHIQILEGPDKIWAFVEVVRITDYTDVLFLHLHVQTPRSRETTVSQTLVFTIDRLGNVTKTPIARNTGPGLDPDLKPIFRLSEGFYQYDAGALGRPASVYRWRGDRFSGLDERESKEVKQKLRRVEQAERLLIVADCSNSRRSRNEKDGGTSICMHWMRLATEKGGGTSLAETRTGSRNLPIPSRRTNITSRSASGRVINHWV